ncbi:MAG: type 1 glutamine amidotransferase domain-containing protein [Candidatus Caldarchaeum sp.]|nr:type 1 glutamine amidotransferase domain-containing protein [Candidatus Caldarchaeum sp.]
MKAAVLVGPEFEDLELFYPLIRLREEGFDVDVIGPEKRVYRGKHGLEVEADKQVGDANPEDYDCLVIPGGWAPDRLRRDGRVVSFVARFFQTGKPVAAICHGPQLLISAKVLKGYRLTGSAAVKDDIENAGGMFEDKPVVVDRHLITSRHPGDLHVFVKTLLNQMKK